MALDRDLLFELIVAEILIPIEHNLGDERFFAYQKGQGDPALPRFCLYLHVFKEPGFVKDFDLSADILRGVRIAGLQRQSADNRRQFDPLVPSNLYRRHFDRGLLRSGCMHRQYPAGQCDEDHDEEPTRRG